MTKQIRMTRPNRAAFRHWISSFIRHSSFVLRHSADSRSSFVIFLMEILHSTADLAQLDGPLFLAIGAFDGVHLGHQAVISTSARHAHSEDGTPVVVTFDPHPAKVLRPENPPHLITSTPHKIALIRALGVGHLLIIPFDKDFAQTEAEDFVAQLTENARAAARNLCRP